MLLNFLELSPTYNADARRLTKKRRELMLTFLDPEYRASRKAVRDIREALRGGEFEVSKHQVYQDLWIWREFYALLNIKDPQSREARLAELMARKDGGAAFVARCFVADGIRTWEDVERIQSSRTAAAQLVLSADTESDIKTKPAPPSLAEIVQERMSAERRYEELLLEIMAGLQGDVQALREKVNNLEEEIGNVKTAVASEEPRFAAIVQKAEKMRRASTLAELPKHTQSAVYWSEELEVIFSDLFEAFLSDKGTHPSECRQILKAVKIAARFGPFHNSLKTEKWENRRLPGVPKDVEIWWYSRASESIRFSWAQVADEVKFFNLYRKQDIG